MRKQISVLVVAAAMVSAMALSACNTVKGAGEDVTAAGKAVSNTAEDTKNDINK